MIPTLTTDRLTLRAPTEADFPVMAEFYASDRSQFVGGPMPPDHSPCMIYRHPAPEALT